jgi:hypothetical protein
MMTGCWRPCCSPISFPPRSWPLTWATAAGVSCSTPTINSPASSSRVSAVDSLIEPAMAYSRHSTVPHGRYARRQPSATKSAASAWRSALAFTPERSSGAATTSVVSPSTLRFQLPDVTPGTPVDPRTTLSIGIDHPLCQGRKAVASSTRSSSVMGVRERTLGPRLRPLDSAGPEDQQHDVEPW